MQPDAGKLQLQMQRCVSLAESRLKREVKEVIGVKSLNRKEYKEIEIRMQKFGTDSFFVMFHYSPRPKASGIVTCIDFSPSLGELCNQFQDKRGYIMEVWGPYNDKWPKRNRLPY